MAELPIAPGQVYIEVEYDYEYKSKDRLVTIHQGECYMLVQKTNEDWWKVRREEGSKAFYVPAQYVREVRKALMPPPKPLPHHPVFAGNTPPRHPVSAKNTPPHNPVSARNTPPQNTGAVGVKPANLELALQDSSTENLDRLESNPVHSPSVHSSSSLHLTPPIQRQDSNDHRHQHVPGTPTGPEQSLAELLPQSTGPLPFQRSSTLPRARARSPELVRGPLDVDSLSHSGEERHTNDSESGDELSSSSTEQLQSVSSLGRRRQDSPVYSNLQELKITQSAAPPLPAGAPHQALGDWETYKDQHGRLFYYNRCSQERTWKPPRARDASGSHGDNASTGESAEPSEMCGVLNVTKITENGKKVRKNWTSSWTVLQGSTLLFTKVHGGGTSWFGSGQSKPELTVDLKGGSVDWASKDKSSKKHVIELKTRQGTELLIQSENDVFVNKWYRALKDTVNSPACESDEAIEEDLPESPAAEIQDREKERRDSKKGRPIKTSSSVDGADNKKTKHKLKKFLTRRPTLQAVRDKGYIKEQVFGGSLASLCQRENSTVPSFVKMCMDHVERNGLHIDGLYRVSGNLALIQKLRYAVNHDEKVSLADGKWEDIHVTTGALKMFFRELPEPLFTYSLFHDFVSSIKNPDYKQRVHAIKELVRQLPEPNHDTMQALFKHLRKVIEHGEENRMTNQSVAIVFGPTLLRPETDTWNMAVHMVYQNQIVELILLEYDNLFGR
ncbi:rho GTPase-activating protein 12-like isoform X6 [Phyllopteryx taeniolatus]|uniref:rho GTPase-activating protein 12-like isoform X6 n=1 Tax=Phyllopteryx taeniolatus TaxID=161469 RepID=UPI002AD27D82|nr:rho GTPase-activating protein 12-like isoform X6 [Phyllopteryx taeniolatus]